MASGEGVPDTAHEIDQANAAHAVRAQAVGQPETVAILEANGRLLEVALGALTDDQLDRRAPFGPAGERHLPTSDLAAVATRHSNEHLAHARAAVNPEA